MAAKHEYGNEKQSGDLKGRPVPQNLKPGKPENVDALVSRFLAELSDISSQMGQAGDSAEGEHKNGKLFDLQDYAKPDPDPDLERINQEIENSLEELDTLRPSATGAKETIEPVLPGTAAKIARDAELRVPAEKADPEEQAQNRLDIFRNSVASGRTAPTFSIAWVLACAAILGVLAVAGVYFHDSGISPSVSDSKPVEPSPAEVPKKAPVSSEKHTIRAEAVKDGTAGQQMKLPNEANAGPGLMTKSTGSVRISEPKQSTETANKSVAPVRLQAAEEAQKPASPQITPAAVAIQIQQPAPAATPAVVVSQPKVLPPASDASSSPAIPATASRESTPAAPKPITSSNVAADIPAQAKESTALPAEAVKKVAPLYPAIARDRKISGVVAVEAEINDRGDVFRAIAVSGPAMLRSAAEEALKKWKFKPASVNGVSVPSKARISVNFYLK